MLDQMKKQWDKYEWIFILLECLGGAMFVLLFSYSTSILYGYHFGGDSAQFLTMGKAWYYGLLPYRDMFDHKGPLIFFVDMLGFFLTGGKHAYGVMFVQIAFMIASVWSLHAIVASKVKNPFVRLLIVFLAITFLRHNYMDGNSVEEYCLPFLGWSFYGIWKYFDSDMEEHPAWWGFIYGCTVGVCIMTRLTNCAPILGFVLIIGIVLASKKKWVNIGKNVAAGSGGLCVTILPFALYFALNGCFDEFMHGTIWFNIEYAKTLGSWVKEDFIGQLWTFIVIYSFYVALYVILICALARKQYWKAVAVCITILVETYIFTSGKLYLQYPLVCMPQFAIALTELVIVFREKKNILAKIASGLLLGLVMIESINLVSKGVSSVLWVHENYHKHLQRDWEPLVDEIPQEDYDEFVVYGCWNNQFKEVYLLKDIMPCYKYFVIQQFHGFLSQDMAQKIHETFQTRKAKYIMVWDEPYETELINDILDCYYTKVDTAGGAALYRRLTEGEVAEINNARGHEEYDSEHDVWHWIGEEGQIAVNREVWMPYVYREEEDWSEDEIKQYASFSAGMASLIEEAIRLNSGKWVRYDAAGEMYKGWYTVTPEEAQYYPEEEGCTYYYDLQTGFMAKGIIEIDGVRHEFDESSGKYIGVAE